MKLLSCFIENCIVQRMFCLPVLVSNILSLCHFCKLKHIIIGEHWNNNCGIGYPEGSKQFYFLIILKNFQNRQLKLNNSIGPPESYREQVLNLCFEI